MICMICMKVIENDVIHVDCIERLANTPCGGKVPLPVPCSYCPFRKDIPVWMDEQRLVLNIHRTTIGNPQDCHRTCSDDESARRVCTGSMIAIEGGNDLIMGLDELTAVVPCKPEEMQERYYGVDG